LSFDIKDIYQLITKSFEAFAKDDESSGFSVKPSIDNAVLQLQFHCIVGGFLNVTFDLRMREKLMSNDAQLSINLQRIEHKQREEFDQFTERMKRMETILEALGHAEICFMHVNNTDFLFSHPISIKALTIDASSRPISDYSFIKIKHFYQLETLDLHNCNNQSTPSQLSNPNVKKLTIRRCNTFTNASFITNFPNLQELRMESIDLAFNADFVTTIKTVKHNIEKFTFIRCPLSSLTAELTSYCNQTGIELIIA